MKDTFHVAGTMPIGFLVKFYPILTPNTSGFSKSHLHRVSTREGHVLHGWEHAHWISGEFLTLFDPSHLCVAQRVQELQNHV